jgi:hypothetical protein
MADTSRTPLTVDYAEDSEGCAAIVTGLLEEYDAYVDREHEICPDCPVQRSGRFVANSMLDWKAVYADGRLDHWTEGDICEYLLEHFPRKVSASEQLVRDTPACVRDVLYFLSDRGTLTGDDPDTIATTADRLAADFARANGDPRNWGLAKTTFMGMGAGASSDRPAMTSAADQPPAARGRAKKKVVAARRRQRKAARVARKRSRH